MSTIIQVNGVVYEIPSGKVPDFQRWISQNAVRINQAPQNISESLWDVPSNKNYKPGDQLING